MEFLYFLARRLLWSILVLVGLSIIIFIIARVVPGDPARISLGPLATAEQVAELQSEMGLDRSIPSQYLGYVGGLLQGDLGRSLLTQRSVNRDIGDTFSATFELVIATVIVSMIIGVPAGVMAARNKDGWLDNSSRFVALLGVVTPAFFLAILLQILAGYVLNILPVTNRMPAGIDFQANITGLMVVDTLLRGRFDLTVEALRHLLLPTIALSAATIGQIMRITRSSMIDVARQDYIEAARAYGIPGRIRTFKYMLRPSFVPPLTILGLEFASLIGNAFVVEMVFAWPGMASYGVRTILQKDLNAVMGVVMVSGLFFVFVNLLIDVLVGYVDPRVRIRGTR